MSFFYVKTIFELRMVANFFFVSFCLSSPVKATCTHLPNMTMCCRRLWRIYINSVIQEFLGFFFMFLYGNEKVWVQIANFICSAHLHCLHKAAFLFCLHTCDNLKKESLHEHRELWQSRSKQKLIKTLTKQVWLMFICCQVPPHKEAEWWCRSEKAHHGEGDLVVICLAGNLRYSVIDYSFLPCQMAASAFLQDSCKSPHSSITCVVPYMNVNINNHARHGRAKSQHPHHG